MNYLKPVLGNGFKPVIAGAFNVFSFPFAETVLFIGVFSSLQTRKSPYKVFRWGLLIAGGTLVLMTVRNIVVLGNMIGNYYFPSYAAVSKIEIGNFLQRLEVTVSFVFFFGIFFKSTVCLLVASKGIARMFKLKDYRSIVIQIGILMILFAYTVYDNSTEMLYWAYNVYPYYVFPMQVIFPVVIWIFAEIKNRNNLLINKESGPPEPQKTSK
jgi:spore germination protein KB